MKFITGSRASGKTLTLLKMLEEDPSRVLLSPNKQRSNHAKRMAQRLGLNVLDHQFRSITEVRDGFVGRPGGQLPKVLVDGLEELLDHLVGARVEAATMDGIELEDLDAIRPLS